MDYNDALSLENGDEVFIRARFYGMYRNTNRFIEVTLPDASMAVIVGVEHCVLPFAQQKAPIAKYRKGDLVKNKEGLLYFVGNDDGMVGVRPFDQMSVCLAIPRDELTFIATNDEVKDLLSKRAKEEESK